jgi:hypothetical protein
MRRNLVTSFKCGYPRCSDPSLTLKSLFPSLVGDNGDDDGLSEEKLGQDVLAATRTSTYFQSSSPHLVGFIAENPLLDLVDFNLKTAASGKKTIIISFRGSLHPDNFIKDLDFFYRDFPYAAGPEGARIHRGFWATWKSLEETVYSGLLDVVSRSNSSITHYEFIITGHR